MINISFLAVNAKPVLFQLQKISICAKFDIVIPLTTKVDPPKKGPFGIANEMRLTESSNSVKISRHTKFRDIFLIFKGLGIIRVKHYFYA